MEGLAQSPVRDIHFVSVKCDKVEISDTEDVFFAKWQLCP